MFDINDFVRFSVSFRKFGQKDFETVEDFESFKEALKAFKEKASEGYAEIRLTAKV